MKNYQKFKNKAMENKTFEFNGITVQEKEKHNCKGCYFNYFVCQKDRRQFGIESCFHSITNQPVIYVKIKQSYGKEI
jgi:hypothetical protein